MIAASASSFELKEPRFIKNPAVVLNDAENRIDEEDEEEEEEKEEEEEVPPWEKGKIVGAESTLGCKFIAPSFLEVVPEIDCDVLMFLDFLFLKFESSIISVASVFDDEFPSRLRLS